MARASILLQVFCTLVYLCISVLAVKENLATFENECESLHSETDIAEKTSLGDCKDPETILPAADNDESNVIINLAGFRPDGYYTRALQRLNELAKHVNFHPQQFSSRKHFVDFRTELLKERKVDKAEIVAEEWMGSSTLLWVENPFQVLGDSDDFEDFAVKCYESNDEEQKSDLKCSDIRAFFEQRLTRKKEARTTRQPEIDPWEHEAHQGVRCNYRVHEEVSTFYMILMREWTPKSFESFFKTVQNNLVKNIPIEMDSSGSFFRLKFPGIDAALDGKGKDLVAQRGSFSTNGKDLIIWSEDTHEVVEKMSEYSPIGFVPEGDVRRHIDAWAKMSKIELVDCQVLPGGLRRVQTILATDRLDK